MKVGVVISIITMNVCFIFEVKAATWSGTFRVYNIINKHWKPAADGDAIIRGGSVHHCIARAYFYRKAGDRISLSLEGDSCTSGTVDQDHVLAARGHGAVILARELPATFPHVLMIGGSFEILDEELTFATGNPTTLMETSFPAFPLADPTGFLAVTSVAYRGGIVSCLVEERDCWFLSPGAPEWHHLPSPSSSDHKNSPLVKAPGDKICFLDGSSEIFDGLGWSAGPAVPSDKLIRPAAVSIGDWEYLVIGGKGERGPYTTIVHHFSFRTGEWTVKSSLPNKPELYSPACSHLAPVRPALVVCAGGKIAPDNVNLIHVYDLDTDSWEDRTQGAGYPATSGASMIRVSDRFYVIGGENMEGAVWEVNTEDFTFTEVMRGNIRQSRRNFVPIVFNF